MIHAPTSSRQTRPPVGCLCHRSATTAAAAQMAWARASGPATPRLPTAWRGRSRPGVFGSTGALHHVVRRAPSPQRRSLALFRPPPHRVLLAPPPAQLPPIPRRVAVRRLQAERNRPRGLQGDPRGEEKPRRLHFSSLIQSHVLRRCRCSYHLTPDGNVSSCGMQAYQQTKSVIVSHSPHAAGLF